MIDIAKKLELQDPVPFSKGTREARDRFHQSAQEKIPTGVTFLDDYMSGLRRTDFWVIAAATGVGKTSLLTNIACNMVRAGRRVLFLALEAYEGEIQDRVRFRYIARRLPPEQRVSYDVYYDNPPVVPSEVEEWAIAQSNKQLDLLSVRTRIDKFDADELIKTIHHAGASRFDAVLLDHFHHVDPNPGVTEYEHQRALASAMESAAKNARVPVITAAHIRKRQDTAIIPGLDDIHGSAELIRRVTGVVMVAKATDAEERGDDKPTYIRVLKRRAGGVQDFTALHYYDVTSNRYSQQYKLMRPRDGEYKPVELFTRSMDITFKHANNVRGVMKHEG